MIVGVDLDNTIVSYDEIFYDVARELGVITELEVTDRLGVREHLRSTGREDAWTRLQGVVYGTCMDRAKIFPGFDRFLDAADEHSVEVYVISHRTSRPYAGPSYDLHRAARDFLATCVRAGLHVDLEETIDAKLGRIRDRGCTHYVDDLPEVLLHMDFAASVEPILFDPHDRHAAERAFFKARSWHEITDHLFA